MRRIPIMALLVSLFFAPMVAAGPNYAPGSLDRYFRLDWQVVRGPSGPTLEGYVYNQSSLIADRMRLQIEQLDPSGRVIGETTTWVLGGVPAGNRTFFTTRVPEAVSYRVEILSFDWVGRGGGQ